MTHSAEQPHYFPFIDGLRAVAVAAVIAYHLRPTYLPGGYLGVDIFFVISGFVVTASVASLRGSGARFPFEFYARRARRILPALVVVVLVTLLLYLMFVPVSFLDTQVPQVALHALTAQANRALVATNGGYFTPITDLNPFTHLWSLGVEEQFYALSPFVFAAWLASGWWRRGAGIAVGALAVLSGVHCALLVHRGNSLLAFYSITTRLWQLAVGVLLCMLVRRRSGRTDARLVPRRLQTVFVALAVGLIAFAFLDDPLLGRAWAGAGVAVVATVGLIAALLGADRESIAGRALGLRPVVFVGRMSYSLYLWHWPVFVLMRWTVGLDHKTHAAAALLLTAALATASYYLVEEPVRHNRLFRRPPSWAIVLSALAVSAAAYGVADKAIDHRFKLSVSTVMKHPSDWIGWFGTIDPSGAGCTLSVGQRVHVAVVDDIARVGCPAAAQPHRLFVVGDSHAIVYVDAVRQYVMTTGNRGQILTLQGCGFALARGAEFANSFCPDNTAAVLHYVESEARPGDVVFMPSLRLPRLVEQWSSPRPVEEARQMLQATEPARTDDEQVWRERLTPLASRGVHLVFEAPTPLFFASPFRCLDWFNRTNPVCDPGFTIGRADFVALRASVVAAMERTVAALPGAAIFDPLPSLCSPSTCFAVRRDKPIFYDGDHLAPYGIRQLQPALFAELARLRTTDNADTSGGTAQ